MPDPTRPVDGAATETEWGQAVHDATFTPKGVRVAGGASTSVGNTTTGEQLQLNTAVDDPSGWLASDSLTVPAGAGGLYAYFVRVQTDNGETDEYTWFHLRVNGANVVSRKIQGEGTTAVVFTVSDLVSLDAGDVINAWASKTGGVNPDVLVQALALIRLGSEIGA